MSEVAAPADGITAGMLLRHAREAAGLHVDTLAANLKVPVRKLEALEEDRYDLLPDAVFARALASSVCRTLKVDAQPVLERLPQSVQPRLKPDGPVINAPFRSPSMGAGPGLMDQVSRPVIVTVAILLLGALVLVFLPMLQSGYQAVTEFLQSESVMPPPGAATVPAAPMTVETVPAGAAATPAEPASAPVVLQAAPAIAQTPVQSVAPPAAPAATAPASAAPVAVTPADGRGIVSFRTKGPSWIQVTDATGTTVFRKLMEPGESASASGALPLSVTVGSVEATEVQVRGKPYNLAPLSKDNVARFEVK